MQTALITGASSGIGKVFAQELAARHVDLVLVARSEAKLQQLANQLRQQFGVQVQVIVQDLIEPATATRVFEAVMQSGLVIDLLINNAGFGDYGEFTGRSRPRQLEMIQLNIVSLVDLTHQFLPGMQQRRSGSIINVSSIAGFLPLPYWSVYAATKAFVLSFSEALWAENQKYGVRVLALCPGSTKTEFFDVADATGSSAEGGEQSLTSPEEVVQDALKALKAGETNVVTGGLGNQILINMPRFLPRRLFVNLLEKQTRPKK